MGYGFLKFIKYLFSCTLKLVYPTGDSCLICGELLDEEEGLCCKCRGELVKSNICEAICNDGLALKVYCAAYYSKIIKELILKLKYHGDFEAGEVLSELLLEIIADNGVDFDIITFVPSGKSALKKRGYNQCEYMARYIGGKKSKRVLNVLTKIKETKDQIGLDRDSRWENLMDCFQVTNNEKIKNKNILLIDDVVTTGATAFYCAKALLNSGCNEVTVLTVAKSRL